MIRLLLIPLLIAAATAWVMARVSLYRSRQALNAQSAPLRHPPILLQAERLARALDMPEVKVMELRRDEVNGLADGDGRIFLTSGFLRKFGAGEVSAEEIASVIAHELGHVAHGHARRRSRDVMGQQTALMMVNMVVARALPFIGPWIAARLATALMLKLSRRDEFEADAWASALLIKAGIGTGPQKSLFRKLGALTGQNEAALPPAWLLSHPRSEDRIAAIEANEKRWLPEV
ncbi:M48 family metalloprotease [Pseudogemmobacter faecipullorum]|uniref:M48 family metalloprotease n=1 Tax=Pseudogemmobacter faecipullorum TaxID=2755041 RepID=A0ABS8CJR7_9RHOB|nr:M48 family metalloprotease [Pseudogemmobacter faecipullorum]MCB5409115.1 M48 family metalloprotease [Pseudogemmobacter faecipullorum]